MIAVRGHLVALQTGGRFTIDLVVISPLVCAASCLTETITVFIIAMGNIDIVNSRKEL